MNNPTQQWQHGLLKRTEKNNPMTELVYRAKELPFLRCTNKSGWEFAQAGKAQVTLQDPHRLVAVNRTIMEKSGAKQLAYFWFPARGRILTNAYELKLYALWDSLTKHRTDGALVRVISEGREEGRGKTVAPSATGKREA